MFRDVIDNLKAWVVDSFDLRKSDVSYLLYTEHYITDEVFIERLILELIFLDIQETTKKRDTKSSHH